jgi:hypothetical protein
VRFLLDECVGPVVARWLQNLNHDVISIYDTNPGIADQQVLQKATSTFLRDLEAIGLILRPSSLRLTKLLTIAIQFTACFSKVTKS